MKPATNFFSLTSLCLLVGLSFGQPGMAKSKSDVLSYIVLTFSEEDTSRHMTINFQTNGSVKNPVVIYDVEPENADGRLNFTQKAVTSRIDEVPRNYHSATLANLKPDSQYYFRVGSEESGFSKEYWFKTLPSDDSEIRFIQGGDMDVDFEIVELASKALNEDAAVVLIGGDIAYANGLEKNWKRWDKWLKRLMEMMEPLNGRLLPLIVAIGNHEVKWGFGSKEQLAPFYFRLFEQGGRPFFTRRMGKNGVVFVLDSGHIVSHIQQKGWLREQLQKYDESKFKMAMYHVPLYPSHRNQFDSGSQAGRDHWAPLFDEFRLDLAMENHDHTMKRTYPLLGGEVNDDGTVYIGDGCWGKKTRTVVPRWYLKVAKEKRHLWSIHFDNRSLRGRALGKNGEVLDSFELRSRPLN